MSRACWGIWKKPDFGRKNLKDTVRTDESSVAAGCRAFFPKTVWRNCNGTGALFDFSYVRPERTWRTFRIRPTGLAGGS